MSAKNTRWVHVDGSGLRPSGPPRIGLECGHDLVFDSWASFRELAMFMRGVMISHYGVTDKGKIRSRRRTK